MLPPPRTGQRSLSQPPQFHCKAWPAPPHWKGACEIPIHVRGKGCRAGDLAVSLEGWRRFGDDLGCALGMRVFLYLSTLCRYLSQLYIFTSYTPSFQRIVSPNTLQQPQTTRLYGHSARRAGNHILGTVATWKNIAHTVTPDMPDRRRFTPSESSFQYWVSCLRHFASIRGVCRGRSCSLMTGA